MKIISILFVVGLSAGAVLAAASDSVRTYTFQEFGVDGVPDGWKDDTAWADVDVKFGADRVYEEHQVAEITLEAVRRGKFQMLGPAVPLKGGRVYTIRARMRATPNTNVELGLRKPEAPFRTWAGRQTFEVGSEWVTQNYSFEVETYLPNYQWFIGFQTLGTLWVDSIQIVEETKKEFVERSQSEAPAGNLLRNGDFRLGHYGWSTDAIVDRSKHYPIDTSKQYSLEPPSLRAKPNEEGKMGMLELSKWNSRMISDLFPVKIGAPFEAVAKVRRTEGSGQVLFKLFSPAWEDAPATSKTVGEEWTELKISGAVPYDLQLRCELIASGGSEGGELEIAEVRVQQRALDDPEKSPPVFGVVADREMSAYVAGEMPELTLMASGLGDQSEVVNWQLVDPTQQLVREGTWTVSEGSVSKYLEDLAVGWYQLRWQSAWSSNSDSGSLNIAVVPPTDRVEADRSPWGIHVEGGDLGVRKMTLLGSRWLRINNPLWTKWTAVQPEADTWIFPDEYLEKFTKAGIGIVGSLDRTPLWMARNPEDHRIGTDYLGAKADLPKEWGPWEEYVRKMVRRYKDTIKYWEVWNEPDIVFLNPPEGMTNAEAYLQLLEHSTPVIKAENPDAKVIASPAYLLKKRSSPEGYQENFTEQLIELGGMKYIDIFGIHYYLHQGDRLFENPEKYEAKLGMVRDAMKAAGNEPVLWNTEWGVINFMLPSNGVDLPSNNGMTSEQGAQEMVVWSVGQLAAGIEKLFWYDGQDNFYYHFHVTKNFFEYRQPRSIFVAYAVLTKVLDGLIFESRRTEDGGATVVRFQSEGETLDVVYCEPGESVSHRIEEAQVALDYLGRRIETGKDGTIDLAIGPIYAMTPERRDLTLGDVVPIKND